jgi:8-oxo-dGDP phosphatase
MPPYPVEQTRIAYDGRLSRVRVDRVRFPGGDVADREIVEHPSAVAVVAVDDDGGVVLVRQYRHPVGERLLELPAGILDVDEESPAEAVRRELAEEAGVAVEELTELVTFHNSAGWTEESTTVYLGRGAHPCDVPEGFEPRAEEADLEVVRLPLREALTRARNGGIADAKTLIGVLLAADRLLGGTAEAD